MTKKKNPEKRRFPPSHEADDLDDKTTPGFDDTVLFLDESNSPRLGTVFKRFIQKDRNTGAEWDMVCIQIMFIDKDTGKTHVQFIYRLATDVRVVLKAK